MHYILLYKCKGKCGGDKDYSNTFTVPMPLHFWVERLFCPNCFYENWVEIGDPVYAKMSVSNCV